MIKKMELTVGQGPIDYYPFITLCALDVICGNQLVQNLINTDIS